jgi:hypothetical protein
VILCFGVILSVDICFCCSHEQCEVGDWVAYDCHYCVICCDMICDYMLYLLGCKLCAQRGLGSNLKEVKWELDTRCKEKSTGELDFYVTTSLLRSLGLLFLTYICL